MTPQSVGIFDEGLSQVAKFNLVVQVRDGLVEIEDDERSGADETFQRHRQFGQNLVVLLRVVSASDTQRAGRKEQRLT